MNSSIIKHATPRNGEPGTAVTTTLKRVVIHSDGGCQGNPGPGAWACVLEYRQQKLELVGGELATTNNRMELSAAINALKALNQRCEVEFYTDSEYLRQGITAWVNGWKRNGWRTQTKQPVKNRDLWQQLDELAGRHVVNWRWLKGHAGHCLNERCDELAGKKMSEIRKRHGAEELKRALEIFRRSENPGSVGILPTRTSI